MHNSSHYSTATYMPNSGATYMPNSGYIDRIILEEKLGS